ncbi:hypothetical protein NE237_000283 [Protea cynaroides]|uniref:Uncharacterized protein n=1 Tax=Protea cynaroides TaxID=273540 RepID=A0A9Q0QXA5_9MAGN|nr:hypothetical protein NE237_000283 [Protea cynaroides]
MKAAISSGPSMYPLPLKSFAVMAPLAPELTECFPFFLRKLSISSMLIRPAITVGVKFLQKTLHLFVEKLTHVCFTGDCVELRSRSRKLKGKVIVGISKLSQPVTQLIPIERSEMKIPDQVHLRKWVSNLFPHFQVMLLTGKE